MARSFRSGADILRNALEVVPFGDAHPADTSGGTLKTPLSAAQLLLGGDRLRREDGPKPSSETVLRWTAHTLTAIASAGPPANAIGLQKHHFKAPLTEFNSGVDARKSTPDDDHIA